MSDFNWADLDNSWSQAEQPESAKQDYESVPDGPYVCVIDRVEFKTSKSGNPYLNWVLIVDNGPHEGRWLFKRNMLANAQNMKFLKQDLASCGVELPDKLSDLALESLLDKTVKVSKKTKNDFENIYIDSVISEMKTKTTVSNASSFGGGGDDDIPF
jgi:hypothetical protein|tara:strand:+ start:1534 stop:2004 length:471 start_codon:yes stop_codon:yes gene_type:complete